MGHGSTLNLLLLQFLFFIVQFCDFQKLFQEISVRSIISGIFRGMKGTQELFSFFSLLIEMKSLSRSYTEENTHQNVLQYLLYRAFVVAFEKKENTALSLNKMRGFLCTV